jgi:pSer/pThr/pTyr-binding forkhead associated (FHA) protein
MEGNDIQLSDTKPFNVSREHFAIERGPDGVQVRDRGSYVGTIVNGVPIGGYRRVATVPLAVGENEVVAGSPRSPFRFRVVVSVRELSSTGARKTSRRLGRYAGHV